MIRAEAHARAAERPAPVLIQAANVVQHLGAFEHAQRLGDLERDPAREALQFGAVLQLNRGTEKAHDVGLEPGAQATIDLFARGPVSCSSARMRMRGS